MNGCLVAEVPWRSEDAGLMFVWCSIAWICHGLWRLVVSSSAACRAFWHPSFVDVCRRVQKQQRIFYICIIYNRWGEAGWNAWSNKIFVIVLEKGFVLADRKTFENCVVLWLGRSKAFVEVSCRSVLCWIMKCDAKSRNAHNPVPAPCCGLTAAQGLFLPFSTSRDKASTTALQIPLLKWIFNSE